MIIVVRHAIGLQADSDAPTEQIIKNFKKRVMRSGIIYKARGKIRWETSQEKRIRKQLKKHFLAKVQKNNVQYLLKFFQPVQYQNVP